jgi:RNA polymerase sigma-70 factor (ECF subfamily)
MGLNRNGGIGELTASPDLLLGSFQLHRPALLRFLTGRLGCRSTAEDLAQEAFLLIFGTSGTVRNPRALLFVIAGNLALDHHRVQSRRAEILREAHHILWQEVDEITPERAADAGQQVEMLVAAVEKLAPIARNIFYLTYYEGLRQQDVAQRLGVSRTTVKKHMRRVLECLAVAAADL